MNIPNDDKHNECPLEVRYLNQFVHNKDLTSLNILAFKAKNEYYQKMLDFQQDITILFDNIYKNIQNQESEILSYLSTIFIDIQKLLMENEKKFESLFLDDILKQMEANYFPKCPESNHS